MTVAELIELLKEENPDAKVVNKYTNEAPVIHTHRLITDEDRWDEYECVIS